jgi:hypothetical protein
MTTNTWPRRRLLALSLLLPLTLAACGSRDEPAVSYQPANYDYLTKLRLNVASVEINDSLPPSNDARDVTRFAPEPPIDALRQMAQDRLIAAGSSGHAVFVIDAASILRVRDRYEGRMVVHLDVTTSDGTSSGFVEARVARTNTFESDGPNATKAALDTLVTQMMADMNVELEFQVRRSLRAYLVSDTPTAPAPKPIQTEDLTPPPPSN